MKKKTLILVISLVAVLVAATAGVLIGTGVIDLNPHEHIWQNATCTAPKTCSECGATEGEVVEHSWEDATCTKAKSCSVCKLNEGDVLGHKWIEATCTVAKTCSICSSTEGEAIGHDWKEATCTSPKTCKLCNQTDGAALGHAWKAATYTSPKKCEVCGTTTGEPLTKPAPTVSFKKSYYKIYYTTTSNGTISNDGKNRGVLDNLKGYASKQYDGSYNVELTLKGTVERVQYNKTSLNFYIYIYNNAGKQIYKSSQEYTARYAEGDDITFYRTIYDLPYSENYTVDIKEY